MTSRAKLQVVPDALMGIGAGAVVVGGLVAAITGPLEWRDGSWLAAYLVLVGGVAQVAISLALQVLADKPAPRPWLVPAAWNAANALVITGTLVEVPLLVHIGGAGLLAVLVVVMRAVRTVPGHRALAWACRAYFVLLMVSVPVGSVLAHVRAG